MKAIVVVFTLITILFGCSSKRIPTVEYRNDSIMVEKVVTVVSPEDSANIRALLECDENGKVVLSWFDEEVSKNAVLRFKLDSLGYLVANFKSGGDSIRTICVNKTIFKKEKIYLSKPVEISKWNRRMINCGYCFLGVLAAFLLFGIFKLSKIRMNNIIPFI